MKDLKFGTDGEYLLVGKEYEWLAGEQRRVIEYYNKDTDPNTIDVEIRGQGHPEYLIRIVYSLESMPEWLKHIDSQIFKEGN